MSEFLSVQRLFKTYASGEETVKVLEGLDLTVPRGAMVAITGESGSGKSTFLHLVGGMEKPDSGVIECGGVDITRLKGETLAQFRNLQVGFVFQFHHLLPEFTALENVMFPLLLRRSSFSTASQKGSELLREVGLEKRGHHKPGELSGGEQQRVAIARALAGEPELLLGDEPTGNLDAKTSGSIHSLLIEIHARYGLTSVIVTHNPELAALCDFTKHLSNGRLE
jgi:lipoprotein-releasing system ATP-binding protein